MAEDTDAPPVVLMVEDEELLRLIASDTLEGAGYHVLEAENADAALKILQRRADVRVLFTDIQMPGKMDGLQLARLVHEQWPKVMLLITSGNAAPSRASIPDAGRFLRKPYKAAQMIDEIDGLVGKRR